MAKPEYRRLFLMPYYLFDPALRHVYSNHPVRRMQYEYSKSHSITQIFRQSHVSCKLNVVTIMLYFLDVSCHGAEDGHG